MSKISVVKVTATQTNRTGISAAVLMEDKTFFAAANMISSATIIDGNTYRVYFVSGFVSPVGANYPNIEYTTRSAYFQDLL